MKNLKKLLNLAQNIITVITDSEWKKEVGNQTFEFSSKQEMETK